MSDVQAEISDALTAVASGDAISELLKALCEITGLRLSVVAHVTADSWVACAVHDEMQFGMAPGQRLDVNATFCREVRQSRLPIVIDHASADPTYSSHPLPKLYGFESYISVPIVLANGDYFGSLCALDPRPAVLSDPRIQLMFHCFARLIAQQIDGRASLQTKRLAPVNKYIVGNLRGIFLAMLADQSSRTEQAAQDPALRQLAARAATQRHQLSSLVNDVLSYARGQLNGGIPGYIWKVDDLNTRLKAVVADTVAAHPSRTIITNICVDQPVDCDPARIQELALNLLNNALAHGAPSGPVSFIATTSNNDLEIAVWNEGNVISKQALRHVFQPVWRSHQNGLEARSSLHLCAAIVRAHLGTIDVTSSPTDGTQFVARIPVARSLRLH
jgi:signal transduction histidine kinase